ncbi:MAG TPA: AtpZ/AtpI family protein [Candidatus Acidoferrales bacterium]|nr:AtpZ/AtpI family protein [Candidatus Acidoferrales bacterium]
MMRELAMAMELPFIPIGAVVIAGGLGYLIDSRVHTSPLFALLLGLLGFVAGIREVLRRVSKLDKGNDRS